MIIVQQIQKFEEIKTHLFLADFFAIEEPYIWAVPVDFSLNDIIAALRV